MYRKEEEGGGLKKKKGSQRIPYFQKYWNVLIPHWKSEYRATVLINIVLCIEPLAGDQNIVITDRRPSVIGPVVFGVSHSAQSVQVIKSPTSCCSLSRSSWNTSFTSLIIFAQKWLIYFVSACVFWNVVIVCHLLVSTISMIYSKMTMHTRRNKSLNITEMTKDFFLHIKSYEVYLLTGIKECVLQWNLFSSCSRLLISVLH